MELRNFSKPALLEMQNQAFHSIFFGTDFHDNLENVLFFQEKYHTYFVNNEDVLRYIRDLNQQKAISPQVFEKVEEYLNYANRNLSRFCQDYRMVEQAFLTELKEILYSSKCYHGNAFFERWEKLSSMGIFPYYQKWLYDVFYCQFRDQDVITMRMEEISSQMSRLFSVTGNLLQEDESAVNILSRDEFYLRYFNSCLTYYPNLLQNQEFLERVILVLFYNVSLNTDAFVENKFYCNNQVVLKRMLDFKRSMEKCN